MINAFDNCFFFCFSLLHLKKYINFALGIFIKVGSVRETAERRVVGELGVGGYKRISSQH